MNIRRLLLLAACGGSLVPVAAARGTDSTLLTVDRIFSTREFSSRGPGPFQWVDGGKGYTALERSASRSGARDIVRYDTETGTRSILVRAEQLTPAGSSSPLTIEHYEWSPGNTYLLIFTDSRRVWRRNTRGDYWILNTREGVLKRLGACG